MTTTLRPSHQLSTSESSAAAIDCFPTSGTKPSKGGLKQLGILAVTTGHLVGLVGCSGGDAADPASSASSGISSASVSSVTSSSSASVASSSVSSMASSSVSSVASSSSSSVVSSSASSSSSSAAAVVPTAYPKDGYCNTPGASWAWCEDFDGQGTNGPAPFVPANAGIRFQSHSHTTLTGTLCEHTKEEGKNCNPYVLNGTLMLNPEDSGFGMNVLRVEQPFDFANREGHIHFTSDMRGHLRMHQSIHVSPAISNSMPDLRFINVLEALNSGPAIDIDFVGDGGEPFNITLWQNGLNLTPGGPLFHAYGPFSTYTSPLAGFVKGNVHDVDIYLSRTRLRVKVDGVEVFNQLIPNLGFDRGYVYFSQLAYNPAKDGYVGDAANRFMWDNLAFDGPSLPKNSLTPADKQDVLFRAFDKKSCTVRGVPADGPVDPAGTSRAASGGAPGPNDIFDTWHVQIGINDPAVTLSDIQCVSNGSTTPSGGTPSLGQADIGDIQVVKR